jgi:glycopeptide antibiotics resistance protein
LNTLEFFPYPFAAGLLMILLACARFSQRGWRYLAVLFLFGLYLLVLINAVFFPIGLPRAFPRLADGETLARSINLVPFRYGNMFSDLSAGRIGLNSVLREIGGNFLVTIPLGLAVPYLAKLRGRQMVWLALGTGFAIESIQLLLNGLGLILWMRAIDINDVLLNALGVLAGYGLFLLAEKGYVKVRQLI